jgi:hypothetical protein
LNIPVGKRLRIESYRGFYDYPRVILASDGGANFWILDSAFDDGVDEYQDCYAVHFVGSSAEVALRVFEHHPGGESGSAIEMVPISRIAFDPGRRSWFVIEPC